MTENTTRADYEDRINRVVAYVYDHLDHPLDLNRLADIACLSPYHWHRVYHGMTGETIAATVKRLRLHRAAGLLIHSDMPVQQIAAQSGYPNVQSFTRIFSASYGLPPAAYRERGSHAKFDQPIVEGKAGMYDVSVRVLPDLTGVAIDHKGPYMEIGRAFEALFTTLASRQLFKPGQKSIGIYYDDPNSVAEQDLRSSACVMATVPIPCAAPFREISQPGGTYAVLRHKGPYSELEKAYQWLYGQWLPHSGREAADIPCMEDYLNNPREVPPTELLTDICVALK